MATGLGVHARVGVSAAPGRWWRERAFFSGISLLMLLAVFGGFSRSYYLKAVFATPALRPLFHVHGMLFTAWMLLLVAQTTLVASGRTPSHRRLGAAGGVLAGVMTIVAGAMTVDLAQRAVTLGDPAVLAFVIVPFGTIFVFPILVGAALVYRRQPDVHKRLMVIATLELVTAGVARLPGAGSLPLFFVLTDIGLLALIAYDVISRRLPHRATVYGGLLLTVSQVIRTTAGGTATWIAFARVLGS